MTPRYVAHRGGSADWPEMSRRAYYNAAAAGCAALEFSASRTSDGVWFGLHDATLDRTSGTSGADPKQMTWAQVQQHLIYGQEPYYRLDDFLTEFAELTLFVDPKYQLAHLEELLAMLHAADADIVFKYHHGSSCGRTARQAGFRTWGFYMDFEADRVAETQDGWDMLGLDYRSSGSAWSTALATGKPVLGHICPDRAAVDQAFAKGAAGAVVSSAGWLAALPETTKRAPGR